MHKKLNKNDIKPFISEGIKTTLIDIGENELSLGDQIRNLQLGVSQLKLKDNLKEIDIFIEKMELNLELLQKTKQVINEVLIDEVLTEELD